VAVSRALVQEVVQVLAQAQAQAQAPAWAAVVRARQGWAGQHRSQGADVEAGTSMAVDRRHPVPPHPKQTAAAGGRR